MNSSLPKLATPSIIEVQGGDRWSVYHRLQELEIPCICNTNEPIQISLSHPLAAIQVWSVVKQATASRSVLLTWLQQCWNLS